MLVGMEVGLTPGDFTLDGDPALSPKMEQLSAHFYCGQTAECIKILLDMEVGLSPGDFVLDGDSALSPKGTGPPNFWQIFIVDKRLDGSRCHLAWRCASAQARLC